MIELRWIVSGLNRHIEYRCYCHSVDASGSLTPIGGAWDNWKSVPELSVEAAREAAEKIARDLPANATKLHFTNDWLEKKIEQDGEDFPDTVP